MEIVKKIQQTTKFKDLYDIPFELNETLGMNITPDVNIALFCNPCYGFGDVMFCYKIYNYIKEWYGITPTVFTTKPQMFIDNGITNVMGVKVPGKPFEECDNIKNMKIYSVKNKKPHKRVTPKIKYDLIFVTPWIGTDYEPKHSSMKTLFPYSNRFNTFLFSEYNAPEPYKYDFPTGIGPRKGKDKAYGLLLTELDRSAGERQFKNPYLMVHLTNDERVNMMSCLRKFITLMVKKYSDTHPNLDIVLSKHIFSNSEGVKKLIKYIESLGYYDKVKISDDGSTEYIEGKKILTLRPLPPTPYAKYVQMFNFCLPDILITGDQSVTDIISCCKDYNIYYQIMPWKRNFAKNLSNATSSQKGYLSRVRDSCGLQKMSESKKLKLDNIIENFDFRKLAKPRLDGIIKNAKLLTEDKIIKKYVEIVLSSKKKSTVLSKFKKYIGI
jgi:hypothetical protein